MATLTDLINQYTKDYQGVPRRWEWNVCDCIGLLFHIVNHVTGNHHIKRDQYIPADLGYEQAIKWLHQSNTDPLQPYLKYIVDDSGIGVYNGGDWNLAVVYDKRPMTLIDGYIYPINIVPGVVIKPNRTAYVMSMRGMSGANIYETEISDFVGFKLEI